MYGSKGLIVRNVRSCTSRLPKINFENWFLCHFLVARRGGGGGGVIHKLVQAQKICKMSAKFFKKWFLKFLKQFGNLQIKPVQNMHRKGGTGKVRRGPAWCQVLSGRFGLVGLVLLVWFSLVNENDLKRPLVPSKVSKASLELHLRTIPGGVGSGRLGWVQQ